MSVTRTDTIDAVAIRDGWVVVSVFQFEPWEPIDDLTESLRRKLQTAFEFLGSPRFQAAYYRCPVRIELVSSDPLPDEIAELCASRGVNALGGSPA